ncbi:cardiomyopathy-associated protein 5-like protein, partial [Lates japonicus]
MEECESLDSEMTELQEFQCETSEAISQDDEDEVEELRNSLREVVQDQSVKPKLQCLMVDPSFSMVTVQSEDSGIVWETASSRCSTPWASETSSISEAYSMEGSGAAGKITIVFDEEKVVRRRTRSGGRSSRLGDRLSRPGSSRSASALGVERPEMAEVSLPNLKQEKTEAEPDLEEIKNKDQQLFSLISEGYEILNIRVPSKLPTVDEEESTELQDNLSYLDQTPKIRSRNHHDWKQNHVLPEEGEILEPSEQDSSQPSADTEHGHTPTQKESTSDIDYFEKFTLLDEYQQEATVSDSELDKTKLISEVKATPTEDTGSVVQEMVSVGDELILLVPKGQAVEMDINIGQWSDKTTEDDCASGEHHSHEVTAVDKAYEEIKEKLSDWISELQGRSENIEDLVSELELAYNSVE